MEESKKDESTDGDREDGDVLGKDELGLEHKDMDGVIVGDGDAEVAGGEAVTSMGSVPPDPIKSSTVIIV